VTPGVLEYYVGSIALAIKGEKTVGDGGGGMEGREWFLPIIHTYDATTNITLLYKASLKILIFFGTMQWV
jgi:hypothetical protein